MTAVPTGAAGATGCSPAPTTPRSATASPPRWTRATSLYGSPAATFDGEHVIVAQAVILPSATTHETRPV